jgi:hypothetical protein
MRRQLIATCAVVVCGATCVSPAIPQVPYGLEQELGSPPSAGADVAVGAGGYTVVVATSPAGVVARRFSGGTAAGPERLVSPRRPSAMVIAPPAVTSLPEGGYVVAWVEESGFLLRTRQLLLRRLDSLARPIDARRVVPTSRRPNFVAPDLAAATDGAILVVWGSEGAHAGHHVEGRLMAPGGGTGTGSTITSEALPSLPLPRAAGLAGGGFAVVWQNWQGEGTAFDLMARVLSKNGKPRTLPRRLDVGALLRHSQTEPAIAADPAGGFVVVWTDSGGDAPRGAGFHDAVGIVARRFSLDARAIGPLIHVNHHFGGRQESPAVSASRGRGFFVVWASSDPGIQGGDASEVHGRRLVPHVTAAGPELRLNVAATRARVAPAVAVDSSGHGAVVWDRGDPDVVVHRSLRPR